MAAANPSGRGNDENEEGDISKVLRLAILVGLAATPRPTGAVTEPALEQVEEARELMHRFELSGSCSWALWDRPSRCTAMVKMLAVALRRVETDRQTAQARRAWWLLIVETFGTLSQVVWQVHSGAELKFPVLQFILRAIVRSGCLHSLGRLTAAAAGAAPANPRQSAIAELCGYSSNFIQTLIACATVTVQRAPGSGGSGRHDAARVVDCRRDLLVALAETQVMEHVMRGIITGTSPACGYVKLSYHTIPYMIICLANLVMAPEIRMLVAELGLPGPGLQFVLTALVVEVLCTWDGGPRYGLPPEAEEALRRSVFGPVDRLSLVDAAPDGTVVKLLNSWLVLMFLQYEKTATCDCILSPIAMYEICMRTAAGSLEAATGQQPRCGSGGGKSSGGGGDDKGGSSESAAVADSDVASAATVSGTAAAQPGPLAPLTPNRADLCAIALWSLVRAHRVMENQRPRALLLGADEAAAGSSDAAADRYTAPPHVQGTQVAAAAAVPGMSEAADAAAAAPASNTLSAGGAASLPPAAAEGVPDLIRPQRWWAAAVRALHAAAALVPQLDRNSKPEWKAQELFGCVFYRQAQMLALLPVPLPGQPPPDVAAAIAAGVLPALEHLLRRSFTPRPGEPRLYSWTDSDWDLAAGAFLIPHPGWLMAYSEPRQVAAVVGTLGKVVRAALRDANASPRHVFLIRVSLAAVHFGLMWGLKWRAVQADAEASSHRSTAAAPTAGPRTGLGGRMAAAGSGGSSSTCCTDSGGAASSGGSGRDVRREDGSSPSAQLLTVITLALRTWLPLWASRAIAMNSSSTDTAESLRILSDVLSMVDVVLKRLGRLMRALTGAGAVRAAGEAAGAAVDGEEVAAVQEGPPPPPSAESATEPAVGATLEAAAEVAAWRALLTEEAQLLELLRVAANKVSQRTLSAAVMRPIFHQALSYCGAQLFAVRTDQSSGVRASGGGGRGTGRGRSRVGGSISSGRGAGGGPRRDAGLLALFGPKGALQDDQLWRLVRELMQEGPAAALSAAAAPAAGTSMAPLLPLPPPSSVELDRLVPLAAATSLLRVCGNPGCCNLSGRSEADLESGLQPYSGGGARGEGPGVTVWCCGAECGQAALGLTARRDGGQGGRG